MSETVLRRASMNNMFISAQLLLLQLFASALYSQATLKRENLY